MVLGGEERARTVVWLPTFQHAVVARGDAVAGRVDGSEVRMQNHCYGCEPANFEVERCDGADCAPPMIRTLFLRLSAMSEELRGIGEVDGLTCTRELWC